jgi:hypothetical protein
MSTNTELIAEAQTGMGGYSESELRFIAKQLAGALEAAEAELTRRETIIEHAELSALCLSYLKPPTSNGLSWTLNPDALATAILERLAAAPVSLEAGVPPEADATPDHAFELGKIAGYDEAMTEVAVSLEAVKAETPAEPAWSELLSNDGEYEYTSTGSCDGSQAWFYRRRPALHRDAGSWETITADEHRAASIKWDGYGARDAAEGDTK